MEHQFFYQSRPITDLKDMLGQSADLFGSQNAFLIKGKDEVYRGISYAQLKNDVDALGTALLDLGLKGSMIAVIGENRYEWCITYLAVVNGVGVIVPLDKELPVAEIENLLTVSGATAIVFSGRVEEKVKSAVANVPHLKYLISMDSDPEQNNPLSLQKLQEKGRRLIADGDRSYLEAWVDPEVLSILLFTSGTTGFAKGVMLTHKNICSNLMGAVKVIDVHPGDIALSILPLHHTYECTCGFLIMIYQGCAIAFNEGLKHIAKNLKETKATLLFAVPLIVESMYRKLWDHVHKEGLAFKLRLAILVSELLRKFCGIDLRRRIFKTLHASFGGGLRFILSGAAALDPAACKGFRVLGIDVVQGYGLTECAPMAIINGDRIYKDDSIGLPVPGVQIRIDEPGPDGIGEILVKGDNVMLGYYQNEGATAKVLKDEWLYTGDLGYADQRGFYYITGRKKNLIVTKNGKNIYPEELEAALNKSPYILESLVWGKEDGETGETEVNAQIVPNREYIGEKFGPISDTELTRLISGEVKAVNKNVPLYKHIKHFSLREQEFAKTTTQKIKRYAENVGTNV